MNIDTALSGIDAGRILQEPPTAPGVYVMRAKNNVTFGVINIKKGDVIYIGKSERSLADRKERQHFNTKGTGSSTVRRTLGAILKRQLNARCYVRGKGTSQHDADCYVFDEKSEEAITRWMHANIQVSYIKTDTPEELETQLVNKVNPPLNIKGASHDGVTALKALRSDCKLEAIQNGVRQ